MEQEFGAAGARKRIQKDVRILEDIAGGLVKKIARVRGSISSTLAAPMGISPKLT